MIHCPDQNNDEIIALKQHLEDSKGQSSCPEDPERDSSAMQESLTLPLGQLPQLLLLSVKWIHKQTYRDKSYLGTKPLFISISRGPQFI